MAGAVREGPGLELADPVGRRDLFFCDDGRIKSWSVTIATARMA